MSNSEALSKWYKEEQAKGLLDIKFTLADGLGPEDLETCAGEVLAIVTGKYPSVDVTESLD